MQNRSKPARAAQLKIAHGLAVVLIFLSSSFAFPNYAIRAQASPKTPPPPTQRTALQTQSPPRPHLKSSGAVGKPGNVSLAKPLAGVRAAAVQSTADWQPDLTEDWEAGLSAQWQVSDDNDDGIERHWGVDQTYANSGTNALWVAAGGADSVDSTQFFYPTDLDTWVISNGFFDLSQVQMADVEFSMRYDTEVEADYVFVGASIDGENFYGEYYSGDSGGWDTFNLNLDEYVGYPEVYIGWYFHSDENDSENEGVWLDDLSVWTYVDSGPAQGNEAIQNGDFESGDLSGWTVPDGSTVVATKAENPVSGSYVAYFGGIPDADESFYQALALPDQDVAQATVGFWVNTFGEESKGDADYFCAGMLSADLSQLLLDFGCLNGIETTTTVFDPDGWQQVQLDLTAEEWNQIRGQTINLAFQMYTDDSENTTVFIDDVTFETVTGGSPGDGYEPNDTADQATAITPDTPITDLTIDGDNDVDFFRVSAAAGATVVVDIDAAINGSALDAVATLVDANGEEICQNDDDGYTTDAYLSCIVPTAGDYDVVITSYDGRGDRNFTYSIMVQVDNGGGPVPTPTPPAPTPTPPDANPKRTWTAILYIDGDNNLCDSYPALITRMEQELGAKIGPGGFLNIAVLIDLHPQHCPNSQGATTRYLIQPNGQYTANVNRWNMGELNMGDPQTLINFANWAMQNYPADHYYLAIDDHGGGVSGISWDDSTNNHDNITNAELFTALKEITQNGARKLDVFAYEACLMAMYENVYDLRNFANFIFGFPTISFTNNASYPSYLGDSRFTAQTTGRQLGDIMFDVYYAAVTQPYVVTLVDSSKIDALHTAVNNWATALRNATAGSATALANARTASQKVEANGDDVITNEDPYVDLWDLADQIAAQGIAATEATALKSAVEAAAVRMQIRPAVAQIPWNYNNSHGLTIYWPLTAVGDYHQYVGNDIYNATRDGQWDEFLEGFFATSASGRGRGNMQTSTGAIDRLPAPDTSAPQQLFYLPLVQK